MVRIRLSYSGRLIDSVTVVGLNELVVTRTFWCDRAYEKNKINVLTISWLLQSSQLTSTVAPIAIPHRTAPHRTSQGEIPDATNGDDGPDLGFKPVTVLYGDHGLMDRIV